LPQLLEHKSAIYNTQWETFLLLPPAVEVSLRTKHDDKAVILWQSFKERLGRSDFTQMHFNLDELIEEVVDLDELVAPFSKDEINVIIKKKLPLGKSPGPDGFNSDFMKKC
jgi:hypothetical protein